MRRFSSFVGFSCFFRGLVSALDFLEHSERLLLDAHKVENAVLDKYYTSCIEPCTIYIVLSRDYCAYTDRVTPFIVESFKKHKASILKVRLSSPKLITVKTL